jgi:hypothetical protein
MKTNKLCQLNNKKIFANINEWKKMKTNKLCKFYIFKAKNKILINDATLNYKYKLSNDLLNYVSDLESFMNNGNQILSEAIDG